MTVRTCDALIVGAGASGLMAGLALAREGLSVVIAGPPTPAPPGRTVALFEPARQVLRALGVQEAIETQGQPLRVMRICDDTGSLFRTPSVEFRASEIGLESFGDNIALGALTHALESAARLDGVILIPQLLDDFRFEKDAASAALPDGSRLSARLLVAADGRASPARRAAGIEARSEAYGQDAITCVFSHVVDHDDVSTEFHTRGGPFTLVPMPRGADGRPRSSLVWLTRPAEADLLMQLDAAAFAREAESRAHSILGAMTLEGARGRFPMQRMTARRMSAQRIALVGEAAHVFPPIGAQGLNLGVRDVAHLAEAVRGFEDIGGAEALARYETLRRRDVASRSAGVDLLNRALLNDAAPVDFLRGAGLTALASIGPLRRVAMRAGLGPGFGAPKLARPDARG